MPAPQQPVHSLKNGTKKAPRPAQAPGGGVQVAEQARPDSPLKAGCVRCPMCWRQLRDDDGVINSHIGASEAMAFVI